MTDNELRESLYDDVYRDLIGPSDPLSTEEYVSYEPPQAHFAAGILFPRGSEFEECPESADIAEEDGSGDDPVVPAIELPVQRKETVAEDDEPIALSNAREQSAISLTVAIPAGATMTIEVRAAKYVKLGKEKGSPQRYGRVPILWNNSRDPMPIPTCDHRVIRLDVPGTALRFVAVFRYRIGEANVVTVALENSLKNTSGNRASYSECYFQAGFSLFASPDFLPIPKREWKEGELSEEELTNRLLYRSIMNYAIGHGCAADWSVKRGKVSSVRTSTMPVEETLPIRPMNPELDDLKLDMFSFGQKDGWEDSSIKIDDLCHRYSAWITRRRVDAESLSGLNRATAERNLNECGTCLKRMQRGRDILNEDADARLAFQLMNSAMLDQYLHYSVVTGEREKVIDPHAGERLWRPFQLAFILMNIESMVDETSEDRKKLDLIWFPTGGGKTEAYLGLSAFTILFERIKGEENPGSTVLMRYTLRLLTAQQFQRAATLICALESMRARNPRLLGVKRITIGLWVGESNSPNTWSEAVKLLNSLSSSGVNRFPVTRCPWCGAEMGKVGSKTVGYKKYRPRGSRTDEIRFVCPDDSCEFGSSGDCLPLKVVDEDIYSEPPTLLVGTVDKFAMIPYRPESYSIFGLDGRGRRVSAPKLVIQDELHLISGPLGSMVALYEVLIGTLCKRIKEGRELGPKIIASTATISHAKEQCNEIFACGKDRVVQFPPSGTEYNDSFFATMDRAGSGRRYVGIYAPGLSFVSASVRLYSQLLWSPLKWEASDRDPYWTVVGYYGTTRELGQAATLASGDIPERLFQKKREASSDLVRYLDADDVVELTGRINASEVVQGLKKLENHYGQQGTVSLCLATNMISVGLDVSRLGLMVVAGQPKSTAEYIQATSRVGRADAKGIVFVLYGAQRPRDRSHYENFKNYHETLYSGVEPSSLTAFCPQVMDKALAGVYIGLYRMSPEDEAGFNSPNTSTANRVDETILKRVKEIDPDELASAKRKLGEIREKWNRDRPGRWQELNPTPEAQDPVTPLLYPRGGRHRTEWSGGFGVPTSLRNVEPECEMAIIARYGDYDLEEETAE